MSIQPITQISSSFPDKTLLPENANTQEQKNTHGKQQSSQSDVTHKKNAASKMVSAYIRGNNVSQASEGSTALSTSRTGRQSRSAGISGSNVEGLQSRYFDQMMGSNSDIENVLMKQPTFHSVASHALQKELNATFPRFPQAIDPDKIYVNTYEDDYSKHASSQNGAGERRLISSKTLTEVLKERISSGQNSTYDIGKMGFYSSPTATAGDDQITAIEVSKFETCLDRVGNGFLNTYQQQLDKFWTTSNGNTNGLSPKEWLANERGAQLRAEVDLRSIDGTLQPESKTLINQILGLPSGTDRVALPVDSRPGVYAVSLNGRDGSPDIDFSGAFIITSKNGDTPIGTRTDVGAVVLYTPQKGLEEFDSLEALHQALTKRFDDADQRESLLVNVSKKDIDNARSTDNELDETIPFKYTAISDHVFQNRVQSQLDKQNQDLSYAGKLGLERGVDAAELEVTLEQAVDFRDQLDVSDILHERNVKLVEKNLVGWLKNANPHDRLTLQSLIEISQDTKAEANQQLETIPSLRSFAATQLNERLSRDYLGVDVDPNWVTVAITVTTTVNITTPGGRPMLHKTEHSYTRPLVDLALENVTFGSLDKMVAKITDASGNEIVLKENYLGPMIRDLNVGQQYKDLLEKEFFSLDGQDRRIALKDSQLAAMQADAMQAKLSGTFAEDRTERGYLWVQAVLDHPDSAQRPKIDQHDIDAKSLQIDSATINGVLVIGPTSAQAVSSVVLYSPGAPDGIHFREFQNRGEMTALLTSSDWRDYVSQRVARSVRTPFNHSGVSGASFEERTIRGNLQDALYEAQARHLIAKADYSSNSTGEMNRDLGWRTFLQVLDAFAPFTFGTIPLARAGMALYDAQEALKDGQQDEAVMYFIEALSHAAVAIPGAGTTRFRANRFANRQVSRLTERTGVSGKIHINFGGASVEPLRDRKINLAGYESIVTPANLRFEKKGVIADPKGLYFDQENNTYLLNDNKLYQSEVIQNKVYIKHPTRLGDRFEVKREGNQWTPLPRGGLGGARELSPSETDKLVELRNKNRKLLKPAEKKELESLETREKQIKKAQVIEQRKQGAAGIANETQEEKAVRISAINHDVDTKYPSAAKLVKESNLSIDQARLKNTSNVFYEKLPSVPVPDPDYKNSTVWYRAMAASEFNALNGQGFQQAVANGYGGITTSYEYAKKYYAKNDSEQTYLVQFTVRDKPLFQYFDGKISQPKNEDGAVSYGLGARGTPRAPDNQGGQTAGEIFNRELESRNISYDLIGLNIKLS